MPNGDAPQQGGFGTSLTGVSALRASLQKRGIDASILDQVSGSAPTGPSQVSPNIPTTNPQIGGMGQPTTTQQAVGQETAAAPFRSSEMELASKALAGVVRTENKIVEQALKLQGAGVV